MSCSSVTLRRCGATGCRGEQDSAAFLLASAAGDPVIGSLAPTHRRNHDQRNHSCSHPVRTGTGRADRRRDRRWRGHRARDRPPVDHVLVTGPGPYLRRWRSSTSNRPVAMSKHISCCPCRSPGTPRARFARASAGTGGHPRRGGAHRVASRGPATASPGRSSDFDGIHAQYEHSPPTSSRSTTATRGQRRSAVLAGRPAAENDLLRHHVLGVPVGPVRISRADALLMLTVGGRRAPHRARQVARRPKRRRGSVEAPRGKPGRDFLEQPAVAVRIAERGIGTIGGIARRRLGTKWESPALMTALYSSGLLTCARRHLRKYVGDLVAEIWMHGWGSRGRGFESRRPDGFSNSCAANTAGKYSSPGPNGGRRVLPWPVCVRRPSLGVNTAARLAETLGVPVGEVLDADSEGRSGH